MNAYPSTSENSANRARLLIVAGIGLLIGALLTVVIIEPSQKKPEVNKAQVANSGKNSLTSIPNTPEGAEAFASSFISALPNYFQATNERQAEFIRQYVSNGSNEDMRQKLSTILETGAKSFSPLAEVVMVPIRSTYIGSNDEQTLVKVYTATVVADSPKKTSGQGWSTETIGLAYEFGQWNVTSWGSVAGPSPKLNLREGQELATVEELGAVLKGGTQ